MQEATTSIATMITDGGANITSAMGVVWEMMTANPLLILFVSAGVITLGFKFFKKAKHTAG